MMWRFYTSFRLCVNLLRLEYLISPSQRLRCHLLKEITSDWWVNETESLRDPVETELHRISIKRIWILPWLAMTQLKWEIIMHWHQNSDLRLFILIWKFISICFLVRAKPSDFRVASIHSWGIASPWEDHHTYWNKALFSGWELEDAKIKVTCGSCSCESSHCLKLYLNHRINVGEWTVSFNSIFHPADVIVQVDFTLVHRYFSRWWYQYHDVIELFEDEQEK